jgi:hypothetical protein
MLAFARGLSLKTVIYGGDEAWRCADELKRDGTPVLVSLKWPERPKDEDPAHEDALRLLEYREKAPGTPAALARAGVKFAFYSDGLTNQKDVKKNLRKARDAGLAEDQAIRALTLNPAEIYGVADRLGSIDAGKIANLVLTDGDWFDDKTHVKLVFVDGVRYEPLPEEKKKEDDKKTGDSPTPAQEAIQ